MMTGGRILAHAKELLPQKTTRLLIVGYQGERNIRERNTIWRKRCENNGKSVHIEATIGETKTMSSHADQFLNYSAGSRI